CDWRGRLVHLCDFNYTRGDGVRSLFQFGRSKPIGLSNGWLEIAIANAYGIKGTWTERRKWVADKRELIKACFHDPSLIFSGNGIKADEPYQFAAACAEYIAADMRGPDYPTHLPIWLDASSNGLQHLAMMRRDSELARMVNLNTEWPDGIPVYRRRGDGALVRFMYMRDAELGEKLFVGPEAREWRTKRAETDTVGDVYELVSKHVLMNLSCEACDESQFWVDHEEHLRAFFGTGTQDIPISAARFGD